MPPAPTISQELQALIKYIEINKAGDMDWFTIKPTNKEGTHWEGTCWYIHELVKYEFKFQVRDGPGWVTDNSWPACLWRTRGLLPFIAGVHPHAWVELPECWRGWTVTN